MAGGGMDYDLPWFKHRFGIRQFKADYRFIHLNYGESTIVTAPVLGGRANLGAAELSSGIQHCSCQPYGRRASAERGLTAFLGIPYKTSFRFVLGERTRRSPSSEARRHYVGTELLGIPVESHVGNCPLAMEERAQETVP